MVRSALLLVVALPAIGFAADPKPEALKTVRYDVADLVKKTVGASDAMEELVTTVASGVRPAAWAADAKSEQRLRIVGGSAFEVRASAEVQKEIAELLTALRRLKDLAVDVRVSVYAVDRRAFEKAWGGRVKKGFIPVEAEECDKFEAGRMAVASPKKRLLPGETKPLYVDRRAIAYTTHDPAEPGQTKTGVEFEGVTLTVGVDVSTDRRFVSVSVTERSRRLVELKTEPVKLKEPGEPERTVRMGAPKLASHEATVEHQSPDGDGLLLPLHFADPTAPGKAFVAVIRPTIFIQAEEDERKKGER